MPIPKAAPESKDQKSFISSCMSSKVMTSEYKDIKQRYAICKKQWDSRKKKKKASGSTQEPNWDDQVIKTDEGDCIILL